MKKKAVLFSLLFSVIFVVMFLSQLFQDKPLQALTFPPGGAEELYTVQNCLAVRHNDGSFYSWAWDSLQSGPEVMPFREGGYWVTPQVVLERQWTSEYDDETKAGAVTVISNLSGRPEDLVRCTKNGRFVGILQHQAETQETLFIELYDIESQPVRSQSFPVRLEMKCQIQSFSLSEDGRSLAIIAWEKEKDRLLLVNVPEEEIAWTSEFTPQSQLVARLEKCTFSPDGKSLYAGWIDYHVFQFAVADGVVLQKMYMKDENHIQPERLDFSAIDISPDGRYLATGYDVPGVVLIWDTNNTPKVIRKIKSGYAHLSGVAFSPDSQLLVTAGFKVIDEVKVWDIQDK